MIAMDRMKIGDKFSAPLYPRATAKRYQEGTVVYIHPKKRFFTVEFVTETGSRIRQSYHPAGPLECT